MIIQSMRKKNSCVVDEFFFFLSMRQSVVERKTVDIIKSSSVRPIHTSDFSHFLSQSERESYEKKFLVAVIIVRLKKKKIIIKNR